MSYSGVEGECDMLVVTSRGKGHLRLCEVILGVGQCGVQCQHIVLKARENKG